MMKSVCVAVALAAMPAAAMAEGQPQTPASARQSPLPLSGEATAVHANLTLALTETDGTVNMAIARHPGAEKLTEFLELMLLTTADQVRFSTVYDPETFSVTEDQTAILEVVRRFIADNGVDWHVCESWWGTPGREHLSRRVIEDFGGSLLLIDNGPSSDAFDNPSADFMQARLDDPAYADIFGDTRRLSDGEQYLNAVESIWSQVMLDNGLDPERKDARGGWINGC